MEEEEDQGFVPEAGDDKAERSARPNSHFLSRMLTGVTRLNQRNIDTNASKAARKAVGASGAASLRPVLARAHALSHKQGPAAIRKAALTAAQQQKLTLCTSLLTEVALSFGYKLHVHGPDGLLMSPGGLMSPGALTSPRSQPPAEGAKGGEGQEEEQQEGEEGKGAQGEGEDQADGDDHGTQVGGGGELKGVKQYLNRIGELKEERQQHVPRPSIPQPLPLQDLSCTLSLSEEDPGVSITQAGHSPATRPGQVSRGTALLKGARPRIALNTLEGLGSALRRAAANTAAKSGVGVSAPAAAKQRAVLTKQGSGSSQGANDTGDGGPEGEEEDPQEGVATGANEAVVDKGEGIKSAVKPMSGHTKTGTGVGVGGTGTGTGTGTAKARIVWQSGADGNAGDDDVDEGERDPSVGDVQGAGGAVGTAAAVSAVLLKRGLGGAVSSRQGGGRKVGGSASASGGEGEGGEGLVTAVSVGRVGGTGRGGGGPSRSSMDEGLQGEGLVTGVGGGSGTATPQAPGSGGKRPPSAGLNGLFSAALRDLKKVKQVVVDEGG